MPDFWSFFKKRTPSDAPKSWKDHLSACDTEWDKEMLLQDAPVVVLDTETTGLNVRRDRIRSIGAIRIDYPELRTDAFFEVQFQHQSDIDGGVAVHELLPRQGQTSPGKSLEALLDFIGGRIIIGHHIAFDAKVLEQALSRHFQYPASLPNVLVDTAYLAQRLFPRHPMQRPWSLDELCQKLGVPTYERHTAGGDAFVTGLVYLKLLGRLAADRPLRLGNVLGPVRRHWGL